MAARKAEVIITCDASTVKQVLEGLNREMEKTNQRRQQLQQKQQAGIRLTKAEERELQQLVKYENALADKQQKLNGDMRKFGEVMKDLAGSKTKDLKRALNEGKRALDNMSANDKGRQRLVNDLKRIQAQIEANTGAIKKQNSAFGALGTTMKNLFAYAGIFAGFNKLKSMIEEVFKANTRLSDSLANIRKVSGLTMKDINQLYGNISKIDTRNTIETLNQLAYAGAKLGIAEHGGTQALTGFVKAAEQVQMALGEDLGEEALPALAKLTEVMGLMDRYGVEQAMQKSASAIFQLGATSTATGKNIVEFSKRLMGLANVSRISADELLAIGSASDAMGLMPEVAATAFNKLFTAVQQKHNLIEKTLDLPKGRINYWFEQGKTMNAIVEIFDAMNKRGNMNALDGVFKDLGSDGARLVAVMTTMADRVDILKKHLETSTKAFKEGEAVIGEYMIQNETAAALMERASNLWVKAFTNPEGVTMVQQMAKEWYNLSKEMTSSQKTMASLKLTIEGIALALRTVIAFAPFLIKAFTVAGVLATVRSLYFGFLNLVTAVRAATTATATFQALLKSNWMLAGVSYIAGLFWLIYESATAAAAAEEEAKKRQAELDAQMAKSKETIEQATRPLERYKSSLDKANVSEAERNKLLKEYLAGNYQEYLDYLGIEIDKTLDLAKAYNMVVQTMKQKKAYEERESYRDTVNGQNRMDRIAAGMEFEREAKRFGLEGIDRQWIAKNQKGTTMDIYMQLMRKRYGNNVKMFNWDQLKDVTQVYQGRKSKLGATVLSGDALGDVDLWNAIAKYQNAYRTERNLNIDVDDMFKDLVGDYDPDKWEEAILKAQLKRKGGLTNEKPDKAALAAAKKAAQEAKQAIRKELQDAKQESDAVISKIEEWYRLQETVITNMAADGEMTQEQADQAIRTLNIAKNTALRDARLDISGRDTKAWEQTKQQIGDLMLDQGEWSQELLQQILDVSIDGIRRNLAHIDKGGGQYGITTTSLKDAIDKNAAGNQREIARLMNKGQKEVEKLLDQYHFIEQATKGFSNRLAQMGILSETAQHMAERLADANNLETLYTIKDYKNQLATNETSKRQMFQAFLNSGTTPYAVNPEDVGQLNQWLSDFTGAAFNQIGPNGVELKFNSWAEAFREDFTLWLKESNKYKDKIQQFYFSLIQSGDEYYKAQKQQYEFYKKQNEQIWENSGRKEFFDQTYTQLQNRQAMQDTFGMGQTFGQQYGLADAIANDPEVELYKQKLQAAAEYYKFVESHQHTEQELREAGQATLEAFMAMAKKVGDEVADRAEKIQSLQQPVTDFAEEAGQKLGDMIFNLESQSMTWNQIVKKMILAFAQMTVKMAAENLTKKIQQALFYKQMQAMEIEHQTTMLGIQTAFGTMQLGAQKAIDTAMQVQKTADDTTTVAKEVSLATIMTQLGISEGAAKTIGTLGWWGIPLVAVISSLLLGLLSSALSTAGSESAATSSTSTSVPKTKIVSGMLTYDKGNVQRFIGQDGKVYTATEDPQPKDGLVTHPIATTVQGQPALVAENGPEIVVGRETTHAIMMNEPELIRYIANYDRMGGKYGLSAMRAYDSGNVATAVSTVPDVSPSGNNDTIAQLSAVVAQLSATVLQLQKNGIPAHINKYGTGGLIEEVKSGLKFDKRYNG